MFTTILLVSFSINAQTLGNDYFEIASDNAGNYGTWSNGDNGGTGFDSWTLDQIGGGSYVGGSGVGNPSLAIYSSGSGNYSSATRNFSSSTLKKGDKISVDVGHTTTINGEIFLQLLDNGSPVITLKFVGGTSNWQLNDGGSDFVIGQPYLANTSITFTYTYNEDGSYSFTFGSASGSNYVASNDISNINGFKFQSNDQGGGENFGINNLLIESKYTIAENSTVTSSGDITVPYLDIQSGSTLNIPATSSVTVSGNLNNSGTLNLASTSTQYSSIIPNNTSGSGTINYNRHTNSNALGNDLVSAPLTGQAFDDFVIANSNIFNNGTLYLYGPFEKTVGNYVNYVGTEVATLDKGVGYRAASSDNDTFTYTGTVNTATVSMDITNSGPSETEWNLIGNPYPSYLNVQAFLNHEVSPGVSNLALLNAGSAAIYGYDGNASNGWATYNLASTTASTVIAPGQGFFVSADAINAPLYNLEFTPAMRSTGASDDFIAGRNAELIHLKLNARTSNKSYNTDFYFNNNSSLGFDLGYDAKVWGDTAPDFAIYSHLVQDNTGSAIALQSLALSDLLDITIPLGVNANQGEQLTFSILDMALPASINVYLDDTVANTTTLLNNSDYVITPTTALSGTGRFYLRTSEDALSTIENSLNTLNIFALNASKELVVNGQLKGDTQLNLYDIQGRIVLSTSLDHSALENRIDVSSLSGGIYVVSIDNNAQQKTQKVIIK